MTAERALDQVLAAACQHLAHVYGLRRMVEAGTPEEPEEMLMVHTLLTAASMSGKELDVALTRLKESDRVDGTLDVERSLKITEAIACVIAETKRHAAVVNACAEREKTDETFQQMVKGLDIG